MPKIYSITIPGIRCASCAEPIKNILLVRSEIKSVHINVAENIAYVTVDENENLDEVSINNDLEAIGFTAKKISSLKDTIRNYFFKGTMAGLIGIQWLVISLLSVMIPSFMMFILMGISSLIMFYVGYETYRAAYLKLRNQKLITMDTLFAVSTIVCFVVSMLCLCFPVLGFPFLMSASLLIFGFHYLGKAVEEKAKKNVMSGLSFRMRVSTEVQKVIMNREKLECQLQLPVITQKCAISDLEVNDLIVVHTGEKIPVDGVSQGNQAYISDILLTGHDAPREVKSGEKLLAGMQVTEGVLYLKVTAKEKDSYLARLDNSLNLARMKKIPLETLADKILHYFVPTIVTLSIIAGFCVGILLNPFLGLQVAISVLVSACPCVLGFVVPLAVKIGVVKAAENGVCFNDSEGLQTADQIDTIVFDLNGTLTEGLPRVLKCKVVDNELLQQDFLKYLFLIENESKHTNAKAICDFVKKELCQTDSKSFDNKVISNIDLTKRMGVTACVDGKNFIVGNEQMMTQAGIDTTAYNNLFSEYPATSIVFLACQNKILGYVILQDKLREDAVMLVKELIKMKKQIKICTGASEKTALSYAAQLGISKDDVEYECVGDKDNMPKGKYIESLQKNNHKKIAMVGDAANDVVAFQQCDLGILVRSNLTDEISESHAKVSIEKSSLKSILSMFVVSKQTMKNIKQNLLLSLFYNVSAVMIAAGILLLIGVALNPGIAAGLMVMQSCLILLNAYRFKKQTVNPKIACSQEKLLNNQSLPINQLSFKFQPEKSNINYSQTPEFKEASESPKHLIFQQ